MLAEPQPPTDLWRSFLVYVDSCHDLELDTIIDEFGGDLCESDATLASLHAAYPISRPDLSQYLARRRQECGLTPE